MDSKYHALSSIVVGALGAFVLSSTLERGLLLVGYAAAVGTLIDLDHFLIARIRTGSWRALWGCLRDPRLVVLDRDAIFRVGEVGTLHRLLSHVLLGGLLVAASLPIDRAVAGLTAVVLYVHLLLDLIYDVRRASDRETA